MLTVVVRRIAAARNLNKQGLREPTRHSRGWTHRLMRACCAAGRSAMGYAGGGVWGRTSTRCARTWTQAACEAATARARVATRRARPDRRAGDEERDSGNRVARERGQRRRLGRLAEVAQEPGDAIGIPDKRGHLGAPAAVVARLEVDGEGAAEQLD